MRAYIWLEDNHVVSDGASNMVVVPGTGKGKDNVVEYRATIVDWLR
jgi:hypothetical protein